MNLADSLKIWIVFLPIWLPFTLSAAEDLGSVKVKAASETFPSGAVGDGTFDTTAFVSVITADELKDRRLNLSEALEELSGVTVKQRGGVDDFATVSIRGSNSEQVAVYIDGVPLNQGFGGAVNFSAIPADQIERIEIYKGFAPTRYPGSAIGGVVDIRTKSAGRGRATSLSQSYGSFKTYEAGILQSQRWKKSSYQAGYTYTRSAGDFSFENDNGTPFNSADDRIVERRNNEFSRHNVLAKWEGQVIGGSSPVTLSLTDQFFREDRGIPGLATLTSDTAGLTTTRNRFSAEFAKTFRNLKMSATPFLQYQKQQYTDLGGDIGLGIQDNDDDTYQYGVNFLGQRAIGRHHKATAVLDYRGEIYLPQNLSVSAPSSYRDTLGLGLEDEIYLFDDRLIVNPALRTEHIFDRQGGSSSRNHHPLSGKIGLKIQPWGSGPTGSQYSWLTLKTNFSRSFRIPSFSELFGDRGTFIGNPNLSPEKSWNWDIGFAIRKRPVRFEAAYFLHQVDDLIQLLQTSQFTVEARNLSKARLQGIESSLFLSPWEHLDLSANYTFQWPKDVSGLPGRDGKFLPGRPRHEASAKAAFFNDLGKIFTDLTFQDGNFLDSQNILRVDHRLLFGAGLSFTAPKPITWSFEGKNLLNDRISDVAGFPLPGRSFYGRMEWKI